MKTDFLWGVGFIFFLRILKFTCNIHQADFALQILTFAVYYILKQHYMYFYN